MDTTDSRLRAQTALVTGANSGIGEAVARSMAAAGASGVINYVAAADAAQAIVSELTSAGRKAIALQADVGNEDEVRKIFTDTIAAFGTLDILVNNAGIQKDSPLVEMTLAQWNAVIGVNLTLKSP